MASIATGAEALLYRYEQTRMPLRAHVHFRESAGQGALRLFGELPRLLAVILCLSGFLCSLSGSVVEAQDDRLTGSSPGVVQARINAVVVKIPVTDGNDIKFMRLTTAEGLSQIKVSQIVQDNQGLMWFGTQYGLDRYDGYNFRVFVHDPKDGNSLSGSLIYELFKDRDGALWISSGQFLDRLDPATGKFRRFAVPFVRRISQDNAGTLWLATDEGLYNLDPTSGGIHKFSHDPKNPGSLASNDIKSSGEDRNGQFWVATNEGLDQFDRKTGKVSLHIPLHESLREFSFYEDRLGTFWIIYASGNGLASFDRKTNTVTRYSFYEREPPSTGLTGVQAMLEDKDGNLWLATQGAGLLKFDREHFKFIRYRHDLSDPDSLAEDRLNSLFEDKEGNIWIGLGATGVSRFATKASTFEKFPRNLGNPNSAGESLVGGIYEDHQGLLWISARESLTRLDRKLGQYKLYRLAAPGFAADLTGITEDRSGVLWLGTFSHGLIRFDRATGNFKSYRNNPNDPDSLSNNIVSKLLVDHNGTLWVGTWNGLNRFEASTGRFTRYKFDQREDDLYSELTEGPDGALWLGTAAGGLRRFDPATGQSKAYEHDVSRADSLSDSRVNSVHFDRSGTMWVGTQNGLDKFEAKTGTFTVYGKREGLPGNAVSCVLEDERNFLWMSTNNGVSRFNLRDETFTNYSTADGLPGPDFGGWNACYKSVAGEMFFGGFSGLTAFYPDRMADSTYGPPVVLTDLRLSGVPVNPDGGSPLEIPINHTDAITLSHAQNIFSIEFSALSYSNPETNRYRYKLEGLDRQWNEVGSDQRIARYTTLPSGNYTFRVQGATSTGGWTEPGTRLSIKVLPPWWNSWWFRAMYIVAIALLGWYAYQYRLHQIGKQFSVRLEERLNERTRIARDLHDTLLQSFQGLLLRFQTASDLFAARPKEAKQTLDGAIDQAAQAITEGRDAIQQLRPSAIVTNDLAVALKTLGEELSGSVTSDISSVFRVTVEGTPRTLHPALRDEIYRIASEALRNAFRYAQAKRIEVEIRYDERQLRLRVRDDGRGIDPRLLDGNGWSGHYGLRGMRERAEIVGGKFTLWSEIGSGTELELAIPASRAYAKRSGPPRLWLRGNNRWTKS
jgi:signal transduction histidine kinase/ligand-binding sensor domain-containing protein